MAAFVPGTRLAVGSAKHVLRTGGRRSVAVCSASPSSHPSIKRKVEGPKFNQVVSIGFRFGFFPSLLSPKRGEGGGEGE